MWIIVKIEESTTLKIIAGLLFFYWLWHKMIDYCNMNNHRGYICRKISPLGKRNTDSHAKELDCIHKHPWYDPPYPPPPSPAEVAEYEEAINNEATNPLKAAMAQFGVPWQR